MRQSRVYSLGFATIVIAILGSAFYDMLIPDEFLAYG